MVRSWRFARDSTSEVPRAVRLDPLGRRFPTPFLARRSSTPRPGGPERTGRWSRLLYTGLRSDESGSKGNMSAALQSIPSQPLHRPMSAESTAVLLRLPPDLHLTDDQFYELCRLNRELRIERTAQGELVIMAPAGWDTSAKNAEITLQLGLWAKRGRNGTNLRFLGRFRASQRRDPITGCLLGPAWPPGRPHRRGAGEVPAPLPGLRHRAALAVGQPVRAPGQDERVHGERRAARVVDRSLGRSSVRIPPRRAGSSAWKSRTAYPPTPCCPDSAWSWPRSCRRRVSASVCL